MNPGKRKTEIEHLQKKLQKLEKEIRRMRERLETSSDSDGKENLQGKERPNITNETEMRQDGKLRKVK